MIPVLVLGSVVAVAFSKSGAPQKASIDLGEMPRQISLTPEPHVPRSDPRNSRAKPPQDSRTKPLRNLLEQPLEIATEAAKHRFGRSSAVKSVRQGDGCILLELDRDSTAPLLVPPRYLGWPVVQS